MPTILPPRTHHTNAMTSRVKMALFTAYLVSLAAFCGLMAANGPRLRAAAEAQEALVIEAENKTFCGTLGIRPEAALYAQCAAGLARIRARAFERSTSSSIL